MKSADRRPGGRAEEPGKVARCIQPAHQWVQGGMVPGMFAGAGSSGCAMASLELGGSLNAQSSYAHAMFSVSSDTMTSLVIIRIILERYAYASNQLLMLIKFPHISGDCFG